MHNLEHESSQNDSAVKITELSVGEECSWQHIFATGTVFLVLVMILAGVLSSCSQASNSTSHAGTVAVPTSIPGTPPPLRSIPAPTTKPINSPVWSDHNVSMTTADGVAFAGTSDNAVYALRTSNGSVLWHAGIDGSVDESPSVANGVVYVSSYVRQNGPAYLYALRASDGVVLWRYSANSYIYSPTVDNGVAYIPSQDDGVTAIRASDGTVLWQFPMNKGGYSFAGWLQVENGVVYASANDAEGGGNTGYFYALQSSNGSIIWQDKVNGSPSGIMLSNGVIYASVSGVSGSAVYALHANDGGLLWSYPIGGTVYSDPILVGTTIYVGAGNGMVYALRADNGAVVWHYLTNVGL